MVEETQDEKTKRLAAWVEQAHVLEAVSQDQWERVDSVEGVVVDGRAVWDGKDRGFVILRTRELPHDGRQETFGCPVLADMLDGYVKESHKAAVLFLRRRWKHAQREAYPQEKETPA